MTLESHNSFPRRSRHGAWHPIPATPRKEIGPCQTEPLEPSALDATRSARPRNGSSPSRHRGQHARPVHDATKLAGPGSTSPASSSGASAPRSSRSEGTPPDRHKVGPPQPRPDPALTVVHTSTAISVESGGLSQQGLHTALLDETGKPFRRHDRRKLLIHARPSEDTERDVGNPQSR